jgi:hypothetical protein
MTRLTEYQIKAMISRLESALELQMQRAWTPRTAPQKIARIRVRLAEYRDALATIQAMPPAERERWQTACTSGRAR